MSIVQVFTEENEDPVRALSYIEGVIGQEIDEEIVSISHQITKREFDYLVSVIVVYNMEHL